MQSGKRVPYKLKVNGMMLVLYQFIKTTVTLALHDPLYRDMVYEIFIEEMKQN